MHPDTSHAAAPLPTTTTATVGLIGGRGYVGAELISLIESHPALSLLFAASRSARGERVSDHAPAYLGDLTFESLEPLEAASRGSDILILALGDGEARDYARGLEETPSPPRLIIDVSADHRFDSDWQYGLPERNRDQLRTATRIANPGCYATAGQLALLPICSDLAATPSCFGVSGFSGAGKKPSSRNDADTLEGGVLPYKLVNHTHEREMSRHLGHSVRFSPHVAPFFRGITMTVQATLTKPTDADRLHRTFCDYYATSPLVHVLSDGTPRVQDIAESDGAALGGFAVNPERPEEVALVCTLDNLRKGAATQAIQNINLALGLDESTGLTPLTGSTP